MKAQAPNPRKEKMTIGLIAKSIKGQIKEKKKIILKVMLHQEFMLR